MKAAVITRYGSPDVVRVREVPKPAPKADEILIKVHAATVNRTDAGELRPHPRLLGRVMFGMLRPRRSIFGLDFAGEVEALGAGVSSFKPGDRVFGMCPMRSNGAHAEYVSIPETGPIAIMPPGLAFTQVVVCEGAFYADGGIRTFDLRPGRTILIYGASGAIGSSALQLAKACGAEVTAVVATRHLDLVRSLGADHAIDYTVGDFTRSGARFDVVYDAVGKLSYFRARRLLKADGIFAATDVGPYWQNLPLILWSLISGRRRVAVPLPPRGSAPAFVRAMKTRLEAGQFRAVIDRTYPLDAIADAYRYVETGQKVGIVVIAVTPAAA